ncbi:MAG: hypothetical protein ACM3TR_13485 [Caulobacteraceae bacterium]
MVEHILRASLEGKRVVSIIYMSEKGISERNIRVVSIDGENIRAYCYLKNEMRSFKLSNILSASWYSRHKKAV